MTHETNTNEILFRKPSNTHGLTASDIPTVDTRLLKRLTDLKRYGIDPMFIWPLPNAPMTKLIEKIEANIIKEDIPKSVEYIKQAFNHPQHSFNIQLYKSLVRKHCLSYDNSLHYKLTDNYESILTRIMMLQSF